jgi:hypothetical protein
VEIRAGAGKIAGNSEIRAIFLVARLPRLS